MGSAQIESEKVACKFSSLILISPVFNAPQVASLVVLLGCLALGGAIAGIVLGTRHSNRSSSSSSSDGASKVSQTSPNDPSQFTKDPNLRQSFYGLAYTPTGSLLPNCGNSLSTSCSLVTFD